MLNRNEWKLFHGFSDEDMRRIDLLVATVDGMIAEVFPYTWKDFRK